METPISSEQSIFRQIINDGLNEVGKKFGTGQNDGENPLTYHNSKHTQRVRDAALKIAGLAVNNPDHGITVNDLPLIELGAAYHDNVQNLGPGKNEDASAEYVRKIMEESKIFTPEDVAKVCGMIAGTKVSIIDGMIHQAGGSGYETLILADADLHTLGSPFEIYWSQALNLLEEILGRPPSENEISNFAKTQVAILSNHQYFTPEAGKLFPYQADNLKQIKAKFNL